MSSSALVVSASYDKQVRLWDAASGRTVKCFTFQDSQINTMFLLPDTGYLAIAGFGVVRLYDLASYMKGAGGAPAAGGGPPAQQQQQVPTVISSFESPGSMNFTSIGVVPLLQQDLGSGRSSPSPPNTGDSSSSAAMGDIFLGTVVFSDLANTLNEGEHYNTITSLLCATSEDGHIRFLNPMSPTTLYVVKDIATGAAITCSAVSPDRRYLLTGNQMGQVCVWHLPSVVASITFEKMQRKKRVITAASIAAAEEEAKKMSEGAAAGENKDPEKKTEAGGEDGLTDQEEIIKAFGSYPLQEIAFPNDYTAIRSISIEPLGRWAAVATNAGNVHLIRLSRDPTVGGSKCWERTQDLEAAATLEAATAAVAEGGVKSGNSSAMLDTTPLATTGSGKRPGRTGQGPRESIYRSALVVNELSANARRMSGVTVDSAGGGGGGLLGSPRSQGGTGNSIGAALLDQLEQRHSNMNSRTSNGNSLHGNTTIGGGIIAGEQRPMDADKPAPHRLADTLEMEVFHTINAHYKYILKVLISPACDVLVTCSADYSVGRYLIPAVLKDPQVAAEAVAAATEKAVQRMMQKQHAHPDVVPELAVAHPEGDSGVTAAAPPSVGDGPLQASKGPSSGSEASFAAVDGDRTASSSAHTPLGHSQESEKELDPLAELSASIQFTPLKPLVGHQRWVWDCVFSDCGRYLFSASSDNTLRLWNELLTDRAQSTSFMGHTKPVVSVLLCYDKQMRTVQHGLMCLRGAALVSAMRSCSSAGSGRDEKGSATSSSPASSKTQAKEAAANRLSSLFRESHDHAVWMRRDRDTTGTAQLFQEEDDTRVVAAAPGPSSSSTVRDRALLDEDEHGEAGLVPCPDLHHGSAVQQASPVEVLEQELLDDNFYYYPPLQPLQETGDLVHSAEGAASLPRKNGEVVDGLDRAPEEMRYVPGQQIIPPGLTRYRVDVQYQGGDFDGWSKSTQKRVRHATDASAAATPRERVGDGPMASKHHACTVLEEALAVAFDVPSLRLVAAAIPEVGVSVRRLTCHFDVASDIELQPRTIIQRATMWLHKRHQPLAVLSCQPCKNQDFHARHSGVRRVYCYRILNRIAPPLFDAGLQWHVDRHLDVARMQRVAAAMQGTKDFGFFADPKMANALRRAAKSSSGGAAIVTAAYSAENEPLTSLGLAPGEVPAAPKVPITRGLTNLDRAAALPTFNDYGQKVIHFDSKPRVYQQAKTNLPTIRTVDAIEVVRQEDEVCIWFVGQSFLRHQIRNMVSVLKASGHGLWDEQELQHAFQAGFEVSRSKFRRERLPPAPVHGLTLWDVDYPAKHKPDYVSYMDSGPLEEAAALSLDH